MADSDHQNCEVHATKIKYLEKGVGEIRTDVREIRDTLLTRPTPGWAKAVTILGALAGMLFGTTVTLICFIVKGV